MTNTHSESRSIVRQVAELIPIAGMSFLALAVIVAAAGFDYPQLLMERWVSFSFGIAVGSIIPLLYIIHEG
jgi:hypothetical protein